jgi:hypothetical protein
VAVRGTADVVEATLEVRLVDDRGAVLAERTVTATSGTGTRGRFAVALRYAIRSGGGRLAASERSARDGRPAHEFSVGLHLVP